MSIGAFSSDSRTRKSTQDNRIANSDQGVVQVNRVAKNGKLNSPNNSKTYKIGKNGTLNEVTNVTNTSTVDVTALGDAVSHELHDSLGLLAAQLSAHQGPETNDPVTNAVNHDLVTHIQDNETASTDAVKSGLSSTITHWILYGLAAVAAVAVAWMIFGKGKRA